MYTVGGSEAISRDMDNLLFSSNFKYPSQTEFAKSKEMMHSDLYDYNHSQLHHQQQQPPPPPQQPPRQQQSSNLARYRSAPSSFFASLLNDGVDGSNYTNGESMNPESEMMFPRFNSGEGDSHDLKFGANLKQEMAESVNDYSVSASDMVYVAPAPNLNPVTSAIPSVENSFRGLNSSMGMENLNQLKKSSGGNCSNLIRQSSSPAGFLSNLVDEIGFGATNDMGNFRASNQTNMEVSSTTSRLNNHMNYSSGQSSHSRFMPQITENGNENVGTSSQQNGHLGSGQNGDHSNRHYLPTIPNDSSYTSLKRNRDGEMKMFSNLNGLDTQNGDSKHYNSGLLHQLSLPSTSAEMATIENFLQFQQDTVVPCKIRAKRGFATHPRSIAERVRRTRISERMKKLQELFPNMDKQANTADMLDLAVEFIKDLQKEVQTLNETRARCTCSSKIKQTIPTS